MFKTKLLLPLLIIAIVFVVNGQMSSKPRLYAGLFKATNPEFLKKGPTPEQMPFVKEHMAYWKKLTDDGVCLIAGHTLNDDESGFGLAVVRMEEKSSAQKLFAEDPMVRAGILQVTVFPFEGLEGKR